VSNGSTPGSTHTKISQADRPTTQCQTQM
jgi:hypothetical protein